MFSHTLKSADWANTTIAAGDTAEEIDKLRRGVDGHMSSTAASASGGHSCGSDLIDVFYLDLMPYVAGEGRRMFDDVGMYRPLDLVSSTTFSNGTLGLEYRRHR